LPPKYSGVTTKNNVDCGGRENTGVRRGAGKVTVESESDIDGMKALSVRDKDWRRELEGFVGSNSTADSTNSEKAFE
jgi:hypothetical protein